MRRRAVESEVMRAVPSVKDQFMTFVEEVLPHKPKKNADCTGAEAVHEKVSGSSCSWTATAGRESARSRRWSRR